MAGVLLTGVGIAVRILLEAPGELHVGGRWILVLLIVSVAACAIYAYRTVRLLNKPTESPDQFYGADILAMSIWSRTDSALLHYGEVLERLQAVIEAKAVEVQKVLEWAIVAILLLLALSVTIYLTGNVTP